MKLLKSAALGAFTAFCLGSSAYAADLDTPHVTTSGPTTALFFGGDVRQRSYFGYAGFVFAPFADLTQNGWLLRGTVGGGEYEYDNAAVAGGEVDGDHVEVDATIGYQMYLDIVRVSLYAGVNIQDHDHSPNDPGNSTRGTEVGFKVIGEMETLASSMFYGNLQASFSTANDTYWGRGRVGMRLDQFVIGPELMLSGNDEYDAVRVGGFVMTDLGMFNISLSAGFADVDGSQGDDSAYGAFGIGVAF